MQAPGFDDSHVSDAILGSNHCKARRFEECMFIMTIGQYRLWKTGQKLSGKRKEEVR